MKKILLALLIIVLCFSIVCFKPNAYDKNFSRNSNKILISKLKSSKYSSEGRIFYGTWVVKKVLAYGRVTAYGNKEIKKMIGIKIIYNEDKAVYNNKILKKPYYDISSVNKDDFFTSEGYVELSDLGVSKKSITEVDVLTDKKTRNIWDTDGSYFFIKNKNCLILVAGGVFFDLVRKSK